MGVRKYASEVIKEGKRVRWPKKEIFFPTLLTVIVICVFCALVLSIEDWAAGTLIGQLKELFKGLGGNSGGGEEASTSEAADAAIRVIRSLF